MISEDTKTDAPYENQFFKSMRELLIDALKAAGEIQLNNFNKVHTLSFKENFTSMVTETDIEAEKTIIHIIREKYPDHNILSEESGIRLKGSSYTWIIDPIDGTSNYAAGLPWFGPLIALVKDGIPVLGGAFLPLSGDIYIAEYGKGTTLNGNPVRVRDAAMKESLIAYSNIFTENKDFLEIGLEIYRFILQNSLSPRTTNSLVDLVHVADGKYGGCVSMYNGAWDIAAPFLIIREAGGHMKNLDATEIDFRINEKTVKQNYPIVAGSEQFVNRILKVVKSI